MAALVMVHPMPAATGGFPNGVTQEFGPISSGDGFHGGLDFGGNGRIVRAAYGGVVASVTFDSTSGHMVTIRHSGLGVRTRYAHLTPGSIPVVENDQVTIGQQIGLSGYSGTVIPSGINGAHLHFEVVPGTSGAIVGNGSTNEPPRNWIDFDLNPLDPTTPSIPEEDSFVRVIRNNDTDHIYTVGPQYIRHETNGTTAQYVCNILTAEDQIVNMNQGQFNSVIFSLGIPSSRATAVLGGKFWSREQSIMDQLTGSGNGGVSPIS